MLTSKYSYKIKKNKLEHKKIKLKFKKKKNQIIYNKVLNNY